MSALALDYTYRYPFASELASTPRGDRLRLATCGGTEEYPYFFQGRLTRPQRTADRKSEPRAVCPGSTRNDA